MRERKKEKNVIIKGSFVLFCFLRKMILLRRPTGICIVRALCVARARDDFFLSFLFCSWVIQKNHITSN